MYIARSAKGVYHSPIDNRPLTSEPRALWFYRRPFHFCIALHPSGKYVLVPLLPFPYVTMLIAALRLKKVKPALPRRYLEITATAKNIYWAVGHLTFPSRFEHCLVHLLQRSYETTIMEEAIEAIKKLKDNGTTHIRRCAFLEAFPPAHYHPHARHHLLGRGPKSGMLSNSSGLALSKLAAVCGSPLSSLDDEGTPNTCHPSLNLSTLIRNWYGWPPSNGVSARALTSATIPVIKGSNWPGCRRLDAGFRLACCMVRSTEIINMMT
jgi:hypothetical protein